MGEAAPPGSNGGKVYLDTPFILVSWDADHQGALVKWTAWGNSAEYRAAQEVVISPPARVTRLET